MNKIKPKRNCKLLSFRYIKPTITYLNFKGDKAKFTAVSLRHLLKFPTISLTIYSKRGTCFRKHLSGKCFNIKEAKKFCVITSSSKEDNFILFILCYVGC